MASPDHEQAQAPSESAAEGTSTGPASADITSAASQVAKAQATDLVTQSTEQELESPGQPVAGRSSSNDIDIEQLPIQPPQALTRSSRRSASITQANQSPLPAASASVNDTDGHSYPPPAHTAPVTAGELPPTYESLQTRVSHLISGENRPSRGRGRGGARPPARRSRDVSDNHTSSSNSHTLVDRRRGIWLEPPPAFGVKQQAVTLPQYLFYYGFVCPPLWLVGFGIAFIKLQPIPETEGGRSLEAQQDMLTLFKATEEKWAHRCLIAFVVFVIVVAAVVIPVVCAR
ncbi:hypothetical protein FRC03_006157 [Tulasnella sp. 419]|nr:hypothetical protein FRC03_006157 [Tulasnella sp. 419]